MSLLRGYPPGICPPRVVIPCLGARGGLLSGPILVVMGLGVGLYEDTTWPYQVN